MGGLEVETLHRRGESPNDLDSRALRASVSIETWNPYPEGLEILWVEYMKSSHKSSIFFLSQCCD
jgi:hypothetical protein